MPQASRHNVLFLEPQLMELQKRIKTSVLAQR